MSTYKQRKAKIKRAVKRLELAVESLRDLSDIASEFEVDSTMETRFISDLNERISYWERCTWWEK